MLNMRTVARGNGQAMKNMFNANMAEALRAAGFDPETDDRKIRRVALKKPIRQSRS